MNKLKAGAASVVVRLGADCFPNAENVAQHDDLYVRVVILESTFRWAILTADMPSMFPPDLRYCKKMLEEKIGVRPEHSWVTVNHSFSAPHTWPVGGNEQKDTMIPPILHTDQKMIETAERINNAYRNAYNQAAEQALSSLRDASLGFGQSVCMVNVNRNIPTVEGWWQGVNHEGFADHALGVLRINDIAGAPIAILYNYSVQGSVAAGRITREGRIASSDLPGAASAYVEAEYENCACIFLPAAAGDQVPLYKINYCVTDKNGKMHERSYGMEGYALLKAQGDLLGSAIVNTAERINQWNDAPEMKLLHETYTVKCQERDADMSKLHPTMIYHFKLGGERELTADAFLLGDIALVGLIPELDGLTVDEIRRGSPFEKTMVCTFVNGNGKSMPKKESYRLLQYAALNSPFAIGSAEQTRDVAIQLLERAAKE